MPQHTLFKISEFFECFRVFGWKYRTQSVKIFRTSPSPGTLGNSKHIGVQAIFNNQIPLIVNQTIVPQSQYSSRNVLTAFCLIINTAVIQSYNITENIKMIQIMKFGIDSRNTRLRLSTVTPQMCHVYFPRFIVPARIPGYYFFPF